MVLTPVSVRQWIKSGRLKARKFITSAPVLSLSLSLFLPFSLSLSLSLSRSRSLALAVALSLSLSLSRARSLSLPCHMPVGRASPLCGAINGRVHKVFSSLYVILAVCYWRAAHFKQQAQQAERKFSTFSLSLPPPHHHHTHTHATRDTHNQPKMRIQPRTQCLVSPRLRL